MGDVYALLAQKPLRIAILDGLFERTPAVYAWEEMTGLESLARGQEQRAGRMTEAPWSSQCK